MKKKNKKKQTTTLVQFRTKKSNSSRHFAIDWHKMAKIFPDKATPFFQNTISFQGSLVSLTFVKESFDKFALLLFLLPFSRVSVRFPLLLYKFKEKKKQERKII